MTEIRIIKKYPNRRLYDTELGNYITLSDVKELVFAQIPFKVIDTRTQKDLTQITLLQIITEQEASDTPLFTTEILQNFIRFYQQKSQHMMSNYLEKTFELFSQQKDFLQKQWLNYQTLLNPIGDKKGKKPGKKK